MADVADDCSSTGDPMGVQGSISISKQKPLMGRVCTKLLGQHIRLSLTIYRAKTSSEVVWGLKGIQGGWGQETS